MGNKIMFSVIIPVYNAEKYLKKCLNSVLNQTYDNYEIIAVDDGSTDKSGEILNRYSEKCSKLKVITQENKGVSEARKTAVNASSGDYISFLDADDWYETNFFEIVYAELSKEPFPIVQTGYNKIRFGISKGIPSEPSIIVNDIKNLKDYINGYGKISYTLWNKIYKSDIIKTAINNLNVHLKIGEDGFLNYAILIALNQNERISSIPDCVYNYRQGSGVSSSKDRINAYRETMKFKKALCDLSVQKVNDKDILKSIYVDICSITKYYSYVITENITHSEKKEIIKNIIFSDPAVKEAQKYFSENKTNIEFCNALADYDIEQYCEYIESYADEYKKNLTAYQKIQRILHI